MYSPHNHQSNLLKIFKTQRLYKQPNSLSWPCVIWHLLLPIDFTHPLLPALSPGVISDHLIWQAYSWLFPYPWALHLQVSLHGKFFPTCHCIIVPFSSDKSQSKCHHLRGIHKPLLHDVAHPALATLPHLTVCV